jgi:hypothetical protein
MVSATSIDGKERRWKSLESRQMFTSWYYAIACIANYSSCGVGMRTDAFRISHFWNFPTLVPTLSSEAILIKSLFFVLTYYQPAIHQAIELRIAPPPLSHCLRIYWKRLSKYAISIESSYQKLLQRKPLQVGIIQAIFCSRSEFSKQNGLQPSNKR